MREGAGIGKALFDERPERGNRLFGHNSFSFGRSRKGGKKVCRTKTESNRGRREEGEGSMAIESATSTYSRAS